MGTEMVNESRVEIEIGFRMWNAIMIQQKCQKPVNLKWESE